MVGIYFSGTGNTKHCVNKFIEEYDQTACSYALEDEATFEAINAMKDTDILVFGYSVQYSNIPKMVKDYVINHSEIWNNKKIYVIATMAMFSGDGAGILGRLLKKYGANIIGGLHLRMPDSICDEKVLKRTDEDEQMIITKSEAKIKRAVELLKEGNPSKEGLGFFYHMAGLFGQRLYFYNKTKEYSNKLKINEEQCSGCGLCATQCPMHNIEMSESSVSQEQIPIAQGKCTMCYRCVNSCPKQAITLLGKKVVKQR